MKESKVETYLGDLCRRYGAMYFKWVSPGNNGVPDRIIIHRGRTIYVETKAPEGRLRPLQKKVHEQMRNHGAEVHVIYTIEVADRFAAAVLADSKED